MVEAQHGLCAICGKHETEVYKTTNLIKNLSVDYNPETGNNRKLLCGKCNRALGVFNTIEKLEKAKVYLQQFK